jgi:hypothetical protein
VPRRQLFDSGSSVLLHPFHTLFFCFCEGQSNFFQCFDY